MSDYYILDGKRAVPCDLMTWVNWYGLGIRRVALHKGPGVEVSTVFLGNVHSFGHGPPLLFETMVFGGVHDGEMERYTTWDEAEAGHEKMVRLVTDTIACGNMGS